MLPSVLLYEIDVVESNLTGQITGIDQSTITTIDDPNVPNGSVCITSGSDNVLIPSIAILVALILILMIFIFAFS